MPKSVGEILNYHSETVLWLIELLNKQPPYKFKWLQITHSSITDNGEKTKDNCLPTFMPGGRKELLPSQLLNVTVRKIKTTLLDW